MPQSDWIELGVAFVLMVLAFWLVMAETAFSTISKARAEHLVEIDARGAKRVKRIAEDPAPTINSLMLVYTLCEVVAIVLVAQVVFTQVNSDLPDILISSAAMILVSYVLWGVAPRTLGRQRATRVAGRAAGSSLALTTLLGPLSSLIILFGNAVTPGPGYADGPFSSEAELRELVDRAEASELIESTESKMIHSVFELGDTIVREVMVPRTDMVYIGETKTLRQAMSLALRSGFSRIPVMHNDLDEIIGVLYVKDVMRRIYDNPDAERSETVAGLVRPAEFTPDSKPVDELLREMQLKRNHMVIVVDEFGGTAGLATIEDIVEEIVGEIVDEYDAEPDLAQEIEPGVYRISARMSVNEAGELYGLDLEDDDVETVGGLMAKQLSMVPIKGSVVEWEGLRLEAETAVGRRHQIDTILLSRAEPEPDAEIEPASHTEEGHRG